MLLAPPSPTDDHPRRSARDPVVANTGNVSDHEAPNSPAVPSRRSPLSSRAQTVVVVLLILGAIAGLVFTISIATTGDNNTSAALPDSVDRLIPASGDEVLAQSPVGVDLADGYDAYLIINGVEIRDPEQGLMKDLGLGTVQFQPGEGKEIESLNPEQNCVVAMIWRQSEGQDSAEPVSWCFNAA